MNESIIAVRYAKALYKLAGDKNIKEQVSNDLSQVLILDSELIEYRWLLQSPIIKPITKYTIISKISENYNQDTLSFFKFLIDRRRESFLADIARYYISLYRKEKGIKTAQLTTAVAVDKNTKEQIGKILSELFKNQNIQLVEKTDERLIGGFVLQIDDSQFDASVATKLNYIKRQLLNTTVK